jgi:hypothetical protein
MITSSFNEMMLPFCRTTSHVNFILLWKPVKFRVWKLVICAYYFISKLCWFTENLARQCFSVYLLGCFYFWSGNIKLCIIASLLQMKVVFIVNQVSHLCHALVCVLCEGLWTEAWNVVGGVYIVWFLPSSCLVLDVRQFWISWVTVLQQGPFR